MISTMTLSLGAAIVLFAAVRALAQLLHLRRITGARVGETHAAPASILAPVAGAMTLVYAYLIGGDSALMIATSINTLSAAVFWASASFPRASHPSVLKATEHVASGEQL